MSDNGYVYVLINPSMEGLVKIGKTNRDPQTRAKELATTGVPTPFVSVFDEFFDDCTAAENFIHTLLENKGYRVSGNREFFSIPVKEAIEAVIKAKSSLSSEVAACVEVQPLVKKDPWSMDETCEEIFRQAFHAENGFDTYQDIDEAIRLYKQVSKLGGIPGYSALGNIYHRTKGYVDLKEAAKYYKFSTTGGMTEDYIKLAEVYLMLGDENNALYSWDRFVSEIDLKNTRPEDIPAFGVEYLEHHVKHCMPIKHLDFLKSIKDYLFKYYFPDGTGKASYATANIFCKLFCSEKYVEPPNGVIKWFDPKKGFGSIRLPNGTDVFLHFDQVRNKSEKIYEGQRVEFDLWDAPNGPMAINVLLLK